MKTTSYIMPNGDYLESIHKEGDGKPKGQPSTKVPRKPNEFSEWRGNKWVEDVSAKNKEAEEMSKNEERQNRWSYRKGELMSLSDTEFANLIKLVRP